MAELKPGAVLAERFEVVGTLGRGGMATVYLAKDRVRDEMVAVKVLHDHLAHDPAMRRRLRREVTAATLVRHEAALVAHDLHPLEHTLALSMPFHPGTTLTERVKARGPLSADEVRQIGVRIASALGDAHRKGVLHRDVTPNNVMLEEAGDAVLTDFGLARTQDGTATATSVMGTPGYAAPEVYTGQRTDPRSDLYSLGAVLYFAASGRSPYGAGAPATVVQAQLAGDLQPLSELRPDLPSDLVQTIEALLDHRPDRRPPSAQEVALALQGSRPALVPEVPDTWNPEEEPLVPRTPAVALPVPVQLPHGDWEVVLEGRRGCDARTLADHVGAVMELPPGSLEVTRPMRTRKKKFVLTRGTDRPTAQRLAEAGRSAGYRARLYDMSPPNMLQRLMEAFPLLIPILWIAFPFYTLPTFGLETALAASIILTFVLSVIAQPFSKRRPDKGLGIALPGDPAHHLVAPGTQVDEQDLDTFIAGLGMPSFLEDIAHELAADDDIRGFADRLRRGFAAPTAAPTPGTPQPAAATPAAAPAPEPSPPPRRNSRAEDLRGRALGNLDLLGEALQTVGDRLPDLARSDLERTSAQLRERAGELARTAVALEAALASTPEPEDVSWIHGRLTRLETLERTGQPVDEAERRNLTAALDSAEAAAASREQLESYLTSTLAQLLEIGAVATRARAELLGESDVPTTALHLAEQLDRQVKNVDETRRELGRRKAAADAARQRR